MIDNRTLLLATVVALLVGFPVLWAFPADLPPWRGAAIVLGWTGFGLVLASLLLMIREPRLAGLLGGLERMYRWHHLLGALAYVPLLLHPLALAQDLAAESPVLAWSMLDPRQQGWPNWVGWVALLTLMLGLGFALSRRLAYGRWRWLHLLLAASACTAVLHLLLLGLDALLLWSPVLALAFVAWRLVRSDVGFLARPYVVCRVDRLARNMVEIRLRPLGAPMPARAGQFVLAAFARPDRLEAMSEFHPFTLTAIEADGELALGIKALGDETRRLQSLAPGQAVRLQGPFGSFLADGRPAPNLWIAGGIGITPFIARLRERPLDHPAALVYLFRTADEAAYLDELRHWCEGEPRLTLRAVPTGDSWPDLAGVIPDGAGVAGHECFVCGPPGLVERAVAVLAQCGVPAARIHFERFDFR